MQLLYSAILFVLFIFLLIGEFYLPSAGTVGAAAVLAAICSIMIAYSQSVFAGIVFTVLVTVATPLILFWMIRRWPDTHIGRRVLNRRPGQQEPAVESLTRSGEKRKDLVGRIGTAKTTLLPGGLIIVDDQKMDAFTEGTPIEAGTEVVIISTTAGKIRVRPHSLQPSLQRDSQNSSNHESPGKANGPREESPPETTSINQSLESLDLDALDEEIQ